MSPRQIENVIDLARDVLKVSGVNPDHRDAVWGRVRDWLSARPTKRSAEQAAACYLDLLRDDILATHAARLSARRNAALNAR